MPDRAILSYQDPFLLVRWRLKYNRRPRNQSIWLGGSHPEIRLQ